MKRVLMIAFQFPPYAGSSAVQRALRFVQHLPGFGWEPIVLTAIQSAYARTSEDLLAQISVDTPVERAFAIDAARRLSVFGKYPAALTRPDRWTSWRFDAVRRGKSLIRRYSPAAIWSTFPIPTAHLIGARCSERSGVPWVADFRDPMTEPGYPLEPADWKVLRAIEEQTVNFAARSVFTTPGAVQMYRDRYPDAESRIALIENGYDETTFLEAEQRVSGGQPLCPGALTLLHSGVVYPTERDPTAFFGALGELKAQGRIQSSTLRIRFRAPGHPELLKDLSTRNSLQEMVEIMPPVSYRDALCEMIRADGLIVMQSSNCNQQIPAKVYEYLRARRPIIALTDSTGDTASALRGAGVEVAASLQSVVDISKSLLRFIREPDFRASLIPNVQAVTNLSRRARAGQLGRLLDDVIAERENSYREGP